MTAAAFLRLLVVAVLSGRSASHWHEAWQEGSDFRDTQEWALWYKQDWVSEITAFYCDETCEARLAKANTIDREVRCC